MGYHNLEAVEASESIEMYLLRIALLQEDEEPVPVPKLAEELSVSPVSANEMSKRLVEKGLVEYAPYRGVTLTAQGTLLAQRVLRHRRLWEVFFVEKLGITTHDADDMACRFEHVTPELLADRLDAYLDYPEVSPLNEPIPRSGDRLRKPLARPLTSFSSGITVRIETIEVDLTTQTYLHQQGLLPKTAVKILAAAPDVGLLLEMAGRRLSLSAALARHIEVIPQ